MAETTAAPRRPALAVLKGVLALGVSAGALFWAFHDVDLGHVLGKLSETSLALAGFYLLSQLFCHGVRVLRWYLLLQPLGPIRFRGAFAAASIGFPATFFLPFRLGELVRPALAARAGVPLGGAVATVVVERLIDGLVNVALFFGCLSLLPQALSAETQQYALIAGIGFGGALLLLIAAAVAKGPAVRIAERILSVTPEAFKNRILGLFVGFLDGLRGFRSAGQAVGFLLLTAAYWLINGLSTWLLAASYVPDLPVLAGPFAISVVVFAISVPAGPGFAGTMEAGFRLGMAPFGVGSAAAAVVAVAVHALTILSMAALGGLGLLAAESGQRQRP